MRDRRDSFRVGLGSFESSFLVVMSLAVFLGWVSLTSFSSFFFGRLFSVTAAFFSDYPVFFRLPRVFPNAAYCFRIVPSLSDCPVLSDCRVLFFFFEFRVSFPIIDLVLPPGLFPAAAPRFMVCMYFSEFPRLFVYFLVSLRSPLVSFRLPYHFSSVGRVFFLSPQGRRRDDDVDSPYAGDRQPGHAPCDVGG